MANYRSGDFATGWEQKYSFNIVDLPLEIGYIKKYHRDIYIGGDIINFLSDHERDYMQKDSYSLYLVNWDQLFEGIFFGGEVYKNKEYGLSVDLYGKLLKGLELNRSYYNGMITLEEEKEIINGVRHSLYSDLGKDEFYEGEFSSKGYSFDCQINWQIDSLKQFQVYKWI